MIKIVFSEELLRVCPSIQLGLLQYNAEVQLASSEMWDAINKYISQHISGKFTHDSYLQEKNIKETREAYKSLGKDPSRYRGSAEALFRRLIQGKSLYQINNIVDANNFISLISRYSVGSYNLDNLGDKLEFRIGYKGESYYGIGKDLVNTENLPVFADEQGAYGSPTSDSRRAMITNETKNILSVIISFSNDKLLEKSVIVYKKILEQYVNANNIETCVVNNM
jgi:DNA/RNA-binding domain of Phe-tRNA-synthetase-like protein